MSRPDPDMVVKLGMNVGGEAVEVRLEIPGGPVRALDVLPACWSLWDVIEPLGLEPLAAEGRSVSCCAGCGACCRQLVPISPVEAWGLREYVDALDEPRRSEVRARFAEVARRLEELGLFEKLRNPETFPLEEYDRTWHEYFALRIPCPFLVDESCSIHPVRPLVCREFLVTSPAENCAMPGVEPIERVAMPAKISGSLRKLGAAARPGGATWVPLSLVLDWTDRHPDDLPERPGPEWLLDVFRGMTDQPIDDVVKMPEGARPAGPARQSAS